MTGFISFLKFNLQISVSIALMPYQEEIRLKDNGRSEEIEEIVGRNSHESLMANEIRGK
jgi:hypothetical protein